LEEKIFLDRRLIKEGAEAYQWKIYVPNITTGRRSTQEGDGATILTGE